MCLTRECIAGSDDSMIAALLSHRIVVDVAGWMNLNSVRRVRNHTASFAASNAAVYSASHDELATVFCFFAFQEINPAPKVNPYPPTLLLVSKQLAQSESVYPTNHRSVSPPSISLRSRVPLRYRTTRIAAFQCE